MARTFSKLDAKVALVASTLFNGFYNIPKEAVIGKRLRKKIIRALKQRLAVLRTKSTKEYLELMYMMPKVSQEALDKANEGPGKDNVLVQPKTLLTRLRDTMPEVYEELGLPDNIIDELNAVYEHEHALASIKYINRLKVVVNREAWKWLKDK